MGELIRLPDPHKRRHAPITEPQFTPDGRRLHRLRQSSLKTMDTCGERARRELSGLVPASETDASALGSAVHEAIEVCSQSMIDGQGELTLPDMEQVAKWYFHDATEQDGFRWVKLKSFAAVNARIERCLATWYEFCLPTFSPVFAELEFGPLTFYEDSERVIELTGTIDFLDANVGPGDWKTSGREWLRWEHSRWDIQPTIYTWALDQLGYGRDGVTSPSPTHPFTFFVMYTTGEKTHDRFTVTRHAGDWEWAKAKAFTVARLIEADLDEWPKNDNHALCSEKWCDSWAQCKGMFTAPPTVTPVRSVLDNVS